MINWPTALKTMLASNETTKCYLLDLQTRNGQAIHLTDYSEDVFFDSVRYSHAQNFSVTNVVFQAAGSPPSIDLQLPIDDAGPIFAEHVRRGVYRGARLVLWLADYTTTDIRGKLIGGYVGNIAFTDELVTSIEILSRGDATADIVPPKIQPRCRHVFGDSYCGKDIATVTLGAVVATVDSNSKFTVTVSNPGGLDFNDGAVRFTGGNDAGVASDVRKWTAGTSLVELWDPLPLDITVGDTLQIHAGCAHTRAACAAYGRISAYGGYDHIPGQLYGGL